MTFSYGRYREALSGGTSGDGESTTYVSALPSDATGSDGDQAYIISGDLEGAIYERRAGSWTYVGIYQPAMRTTDPNTAVLPAGFVYRLVHQTDKFFNGLWEWDGVNLFQRTYEG